MWCLHFQDKWICFRWMSGIHLNQIQSQRLLRKHITLKRRKELVTLCCVRTQKTITWTWKICRINIKRFGRMLLLCTNSYMVKVKVKSTPVQALRLCTGRTAHRWSRGIAVLFLDHGTRRGWGSASRPVLSLPPGKTTRTHCLAIRYGLLYYNENLTLVRISHCQNCRIVWKRIN